MLEKGTHTHTENTFLDGLIFDTYTNERIHTFELKLTYSAKRG